MNCPQCNLNWAYARKSLLKSNCLTCRQEGLRRMSYLEERERQRLETQSNQSKAKWDAMTSEEQKAYIKESYRLLYGCESPDGIIYHPLKEE